MKIRSLVLGVILGLCSVFSVFGLVGCGDVSINTVKANFQKLDETYAKHATVFKEDQYEGIVTSYMIDYDTIVNGYVSSNKPGFGELKEIYNAMLIVSSDFIDNNKNYVTLLNEKEMSKASKKALNSFNEALVDYIKNIDIFVKARESFVDYFDQFGSSFNENTDEIYLRRFKKSYGVLVTKNVNLALKLANVVEETKIFDLLKETTPTVNDTQIVKEYLRAKMLPIFSEFTITEVHNELNWNGQAETETKVRITELMEQIDQAFTNYKGRFLGSGGSVTQLTKEEMADLFEKIEIFLIEEEDFLQAAKGLNVSSLAVDFDNDLEEFIKEKNTLAEVYIAKMEQFITITLPEFMTQVNQIIY